MLILNGRADVANQKIEHLVAAIPKARSASCEGDHYTTPFQPTFHQVVIEFLEEQWQLQDERRPRSQTDNTVPVTIAGELPNGSN